MFIATVAVACLWGAVFWAYVSQPAPKGVEQRVATDVAAPDSPHVAATPVEKPPLSGAPALRLVVASGATAPGGGAFDRFDVGQQPIVAPVNARGQVAFYASVVHSRAREGIFLATAGRIAKVAAVGDAAPGGGSFSEFARHPVPALNDAGKVAFGAALAGSRATEGVFLAAGGDVTMIALSGADAPGVVNGTFLEFDTPVLNNRDEIAFVASVRRNRETLDVLYLYSGGKLRKLLATGDLAPRKLAAGADTLPRKGAFDKFGAPAMNNKGVVAFPAVIEHGEVLGGIFLAGAHDLQLILGAGELAPDGAMLVRFSERVAIDDEDNVAFIAHLGGDKPGAEAVFRVNAAGLAQVAATGDPAPGGGRFAAFGPWPTFGALDSIAVIAALDDGLAPLAVFAGAPGALGRLAMPGEALPGGARLAPFALNAIASAASNGGVTFATMADPATGQSGIYYFGPPPAE